jgi:hypothetical protein
MEFNRITGGARQLGGMPCIRGLRIPVATVVGLVADGMTTPEILDTYPDLQDEDDSCTSQLLTSLALRVAAGVAGSLQSHETPRQALRSEPSRSAMQ